MDCTRLYKYAGGVVVRADVAGVLVDAWPHADDDSRASVVFSLGQLKRLCLGAGDIGSIGSLCGRLPFACLGVATCSVFKTQSLRRALRHGGWLIFER